MTGRKSRRITRRASSPATRGRASTAVPHDHDAIAKSRRRKRLGEHRDLVRALPRKGTGRRSRPAFTRAASESPGPDDLHPRRDRDPGRLAAVLARLSSPLPASRGLELGSALPLGLVQPSSASRSASGSTSDEGGAPSAAAGVSPLARSPSGAVAVLGDVRAEIRLALDHHRYRTGVRLVGTFMTFTPCVARPSSRCPARLCAGPCPPER